MYGKIEALKIKHGLLATGHFSRSYDAGCITIRKFSPPKASSETPPPSPPIPPPMPTFPVQPSTVDAFSTTRATEKEADPTSKTQFSLELPVVFSRFGDLYPIADFDFSSR